MAGQPVDRCDRARGTRTLEINIPTWKQIKEGLVLDTLGSREDVIVAMRGDWTL